MLKTDGDRPIHLSGAHGVLLFAIGCHQGEPYQETTRKYGTIPINIQQGTRWRHGHGPMGATKKYRNSCLFLCMGTSPSIFMKAHHGDMAMAPWAPPRKNPTRVLPGCMEPS